MGSPFWQYFHDRLAWLPIFRPGPLSALAKGLALHLDSCRQDIIWLRDQWIVTRAEAEMVARYGESRGMPRFRFDTDESYRNRVYNAFVWHKLGGKVRGLERIYAENGLEAAVSSSPDPELWAHFRVRLDVSGLVFGIETGEMVFWLANEYKPARSVLEGVWTSGRLPMDRLAGIGLVSRSMGKSRLWFMPQKAGPMARRMGSSLLSRDIAACSLWFEPRKAAPLPARSAIGAAVRTGCAFRPWFAARPAPPLRGRAAMSAGGMTRSNLVFRPDGEL